MKSFTKFGPVLLLLLGSLCLVGCGNKSDGGGSAKSDDSAKSGGSGGKASDLVGRWVLLSADDPETPTNWELFKDGTGVVDNTSITWKVEDKRFILKIGEGGAAFDYNISNKTKFTLTDDEKSSLTLMKKEQVEKEIEQQRLDIEKNNSFTDFRDGQKYRVVKINGKTWLAQNVNFKTGKSWCYGDDDSNCEKYGRLYDWNSANIACPSSMHLPVWGEWKEMITAAGGDNAAGKKLKSTSGWNNDGNGTDDYGFSALPGGYRWESGRFVIEGGEGYWWTATAIEGIMKSSTARFKYMAYNQDKVDERVPKNKNEGLSVRCVQD